MKILIYSDYLNHVSGYARALRDLLPHISRENEIAHVALGFKGFPPPQIKGVSKVYPGESWGSKYWAIETLDYAIRDFRPDIVLTVGDFFTMRKFAFPLTHPSGFKWVHWGTLDADPLDYKSREPLRWVDTVLYFSEFAKTEIEKTHPDINGRVLYPPTNPEVFYPREDRRDMRKQYDIEGRPIILTCGRNQTRKNIPVLLDAVEILKKDKPDIILILASNTNVAKTSGGIAGYNYKTFISDRNLEANVLNPVTKSGQPVSDTLLNKMYNLADLQVHVSVAEGFGMPLAEGFAAKLPVLGVNHSAVTEVVGDRGELVEPSAYSYTAEGGKWYYVTPEDVAEKTLDMLDRPKDLADYGERGSEWVADLTPEKQAEIMLNTFKDTVQNNLSGIAHRAYIEES